jgi:hypothetical protein
MILSDVWRDIGQEIGVYAGTRLDRVPSTPGVYAWFYPLRLTTHDVADLVDEVHKVLFFDPQTRGLPGRTSDFDFIWRRLHVEITETPKRWHTSSGRKEIVWQSIRDNPISLQALRRALLKSSILLPPLYVGKASNLYVRCWQHINGADGNTFHNRYHAFASDKSLTCRNVEDLLFACIQTHSEDQVLGVDGAEMAELIEDVLKALSCPPFGLR